MSTYFMQGKYTVDGIKGLIKEGGSRRNEEVTKLVSSVGGTLRSLSFAATSPTWFVVMDLPERGSVAAITATIIGSGAVTVDQCVEIMTPAQLDAAVKKMPAYRPPGH
jgi:uncharacterized protein with GYD domain